jgi:ubiquitin C-terminal hydrolase
MDELRNYFNTTSSFRFACEGTMRDARVILRTVSRFPSVLVIQYVNKHADVVTPVSRSIPFELDLTPFAPVGFTAINTYRLVSVVESHPGHFTAAVLRNVTVSGAAKWFLINDSVVRRLPSWGLKPSVELSNAFMLFYERIDKASF